MKLNSKLLSNFKIVFMISQQTSSINPVIVYTCYCKIYNKNYDKIFVVDVTLIEIRLASCKNLNKTYSL